MTKPGTRDEVITALRDLLVALEAARVAGYLPPGTIERAWAVLGVDKSRKPDNETPGSVVIR
jgi:hypothetical protein